ncbi:AAA family ATPase, partial [Acidobacteria bacterium ACD]|nr:AAA family ATPase [Acidobacteria bacterium ACD]
MALGLVDEDRRHLRVWAHTAPFAAGLEVPDRVPIPDPALLARDWEFLLVDDLDLAPDVPGGPVIRRFGFRSLLRIPIRDGEELLGGVNFLCAAPGRFSPGDVIVGRRIAGHLHLALSHHRLAEEARRASEARERARQLEQKVDALVEELSGKDRPLPVVGESAAWKRVLSDAVKVAAAETTVLLTGESGTGKEVLARLLHGASGRAKGPFVALNCAALPDSLLESELFGYEKGAFTGAGTAKPGRIELAQGGVLFLDEVAETSPAVQAKLLRVLQEREFQRLGGTRTQKADIRVVAATNRDLRAATARGEFREDLFYRLAVFEIRIPPLRERVEDVEELANHFLAAIAEEHQQAAKPLEPEALSAIRSYAWPGNIRELRSAMAYAVASAGSRPSIARRDLPPPLDGGSAVTPPPPTRTEPEHVRLFRRIYTQSPTDRHAWAQFLVNWQEVLGNVRFSRRDMVDVMRAVRGPDPTDNALANEWQRRIKPLAVELGLITEDAKKLIIELERCRAVLQSGPMAEVAEPDEARPTVRVMPAAKRSSSNRLKRTNLPPPRTSFVGRTREVADLTAQLGAGPGITTLLGPGGTGKTRLAQEVGWQLLDRLHGGVWFADLTEARNVEGVAYAVAQALRVPLTTSEPPESAMASILESRGDALLILDNFEQVVEAAKATVATWAQRAPRTRLLVTSRA